MCRSRTRRLRPCSATRNNLAPFLAGPTAGSMARNSLRQPPRDVRSGACCDGLQPSGVNRNQGAESTLAYLWAELLNFEFEVPAGRTREKRKRRRHWRIAKWNITSRHRSGRTPTPRLLVREGYPPGPII